MRVPHIDRSDQLFTSCLTCLATNLFTNISDTLSFVWFRLFERTNIRCKVSEKLLVMRTKYDSILFFLISFDCHSFWCINIYLVRKTKCELNLSWSFNIELVSNSDNLERLSVSIRNTSYHILKHSTSQSPKGSFLFCFRMFH